MVEGNDDDGSEGHAVEILDLFLLACALGQSVAASEPSGT